MELELELLCEGWAQGELCHVFFPKQPCNAQVMHFVEWQERILCNITSSKRVYDDKDWQLRHVPLVGYKQQPLSGCAAFDPFECVVCSDYFSFIATQTTNIP